MHRSVDLHETMRDFIVRRKDGIPSYQIASLVDDAYFRINTIVRGSDLLPSTAAQRWLAENLLSQNDFLDGSFVHHGLLPDSDGRKLSKSDGSTSLKAMRESGGNADNIFVRLSPRFGLTSPVHSAIELLEALPRSPN
jgi:glutamyl-tRNA synthetase